MHHDTPWRSDTLGYPRICSVIMTLKVTYVIIKPFNILTRIIIIIIIIIITITITITIVVIIIIITRLFSSALRETNTASHCINFLTEEFWPMETLPDISSCNLSTLLGLGKDLLRLAI